MRSRHYTQEIGVASAERPPVPAAVAFVILAIVALVAVWFAREVLASPPAHPEVAAQPASVKVSSR
jgi:hypothetical protein